MPDSLILLGAGASYGSDTTDTPPLGESLFDALREFNPTGWGQLPSDLDEHFRTDFEAGMTELSESNSHAMPPLQRAMAAYFFQFRPRNSNLYLQLGRRISDAEWSGAITTLNYERLLELSLISVGLRPVCNSQAQDSGQIELCLPHGCCHLFCDSVKGASDKVSFSGTAVKTTGSVVVVSNPRDFENRIINDAFPPVMSYFEPQKRTTSCEKFVRSQRERWAELVSQASTIALVGIRVRQNDEHIWKPLAEAPGRLIYCSGVRAGGEFENWATEVRAEADDDILMGYFDECFDDICSALGLT